MYLLYLLAFLVVGPLLPPAAASYVAAGLLGDPVLAVRLAETCRRESRCRPVAVHTGDLWAGRPMWRNAVRVGWLRPAECVHHQSGAASWGPSGPWGSSRAYTLHHVRGCFPATSLDLPLFGAVAAGLRLHAALGLAPSRRDTRALWAGRKNYKDRQ